MGREFSRSRSFSPSGGVIQRFKKFSIDSDFALGAKPRRCRRANRGFFVVLYSALRIPIDMLREYPISMWGLPTGQTLNFLMLSIGIIILTINYLRNRNKTIEKTPKKIVETKVGWCKWAFIVLLIIPLVIPSDATRDIPARYGKRHQGLVHSSMYPPIADKVNQ